MGVEPTTSAWSLSAIGGKALPRLILEPIVGFEPTTFPLRRDCSTTELYRRVNLPLSYAGLERVRRIELLFSAWEADVLPLYYTRIWTLSAFGGTKLYPRVYFGGDILA